MTKTPVASSLLLILSAASAALAADPLGPAPRAPAASLAVALPVGVALGEPIESLADGISVRPFAGAKAVRESDKKEVIRAVDNVENPAWTLVVGTDSFTRPMALTSGPDERGRVRPGLLQNTADVIKQQYVGSQFLRQNLTNLGDHDEGMLVYRITRDAKDWFEQRAIIQANDQLYYWLALTTPARRVKDDRVEDAGERKAVETFRAILDSVQLLDRAPIKADQDDRLLRTRGLLVNLTARKLSDVVVREPQWRRILRQTPQGLRDIGYQLIVERPDRKSLADGINVGIYTRMWTEMTPEGRVKPFPRQDSEAWMFSTMDRRHEDWTRQTVVDDDGKPKTAANPWRRFTEYGVSDWKSTPVLLADPVRNKEDLFKVGVHGDAKQPWVGKSDDHGLKVTFEGSRGDLQPVDRQLSPFYVPQALGTLLPRLLPLNEPKNYLVATYVSDHLEVMMRYLEVGARKDVNFAGRRINAVPVTDHLGLKGAVTTHYLDHISGKWLGSESPVTQLVIVPVDRKVLVDVWKDNDLFRLPGSESGPVANPPSASPQPASAGVPSTLNPDRPRTR